MRKKVEWFSTVMTIIAVAVSFFAIFYEGSTLREFITRYREPILFAIIPILTGLFSTSFLSVINSVNSANRIYISYSHSDKEIVDQIIRYAKNSRKIQRRNMTIMSDNDIKMGESIDRSIKKAISNAGIVIVVVSDKYLSSESCSKELKYITSEKAKIIPVFLPSVEGSDNVPAQIKDYKGIVLKDLTVENIHAGIDKILEDIT